MPSWLGWGCSLVDGNAQALEALAHMNDSYALGTGTSPCPVLDLVYLLLVMICRGDHDPSSALHVLMQLQNDPKPALIKRGRKGLGLLRVSMIRQVDSKRSSIWGFIVMTCPLDQQQMIWYIKCVLAWTAGKACLRCSFIA